MENLMREGRIDVALDMTLHEITCETIGGYCVGANDRLMTAVEHKIPMVVVPGALDMVDYLSMNRERGFRMILTRGKRYIIIPVSATVRSTKKRQRRSLMLSAAG